MFRAIFVHHQERETEIFTSYVILLLWWAGNRWTAAWHIVPLTDSLATTTTGYHMM